MCFRTRCLIMTWSRYSGSSERLTTDSIVQHLMGDLRNDQATEAIIVLGMTKANADVGKVHEGGGAISTANERHWNSVCEKSLEKVARRIGQRVTFRNVLDRLKGPAAHARNPDSLLYCFITVSCIVT
jgi:hypothetical protein